MTDCAVVAVHKVRLLQFTCTYSLLYWSTKITWKVPKHSPKLAYIPKIFLRSLQNANRSQNFEYQRRIPIANQSRCSKNNNIVCLNILTLWYVQTGPVEVVGSLPKSHAAHPRSSPSKVSQVTSVAATVSVPGQLLNSSYDLMTKHSSAYHSQNRQKSNFSNSLEENSPRKGSDTSVAEALGKVEAEEKAEE